jgi:hypothetical protein
MEDLKPPAVYGEVVAGRAASVRKNLVAMVANLSTNTFDLAELLFEAKENDYAATWGFDSLAEYAERELGLKKRKSEYLTRIVKVAKATGLTRPQFEPCGVSKLREITRLDPEGTYWNREERVSEDLADHIVRLILDHDKMTVTQVKDEVARLLGQVGPDRRVVRSYSTCQSVWDNVISRAIESARRFLGSKGKDDEGYATEYSEGDCYECICATFLADPNFQEEQTEPSAEKPVERPPIPMEEI